MSRWGDGVAHTWTELYTRGLPPEAAERRRGEILSDVFEHGAAAGRTPVQQIHVLGRVLWGIPADLSWRRAARAPRERRLETGASMTMRKVNTVVFVAYALIFSWGAIGIIGNGYGLWATPLLGGAALIVLGLRQRDEAPRRSTILLVVGAFLPVVTLFWMAVVLAPVWLLISGLAIASEPGRRQAVPAAT